MYQFHLIVTALLRYCCAVPLEAKPSIEHVALSDNSTQCTSFLLVWTIRHQAAAVSSLGMAALQFGLMRFTQQQGMKLI